ncbi:MAG: prepilin-type N-terminal cleavage/methylation domain-containing protein [Kiritimatiellae bacterium]|nr:prepilin-type N-terminal cleavage/methylation domain-containing protein [Kiritimatiellia bacterium]
MNLGANKGFSLIEVMVATTILMIIVIMVGNIFRHSSNAWETGYAVAEGTSGIRSVLGTIHRELSQAVDGRKCGEKWESPILIKGDSIEFYRYVEPTKKGSTEPEVQKITYTLGKTVKRKVKTGKEDEGSETILYSKRTAVGGNSDADVIFEVVPPSDLNMNNMNLNEGVSEDDFWTVPFVVVKAKISRKSTFAGMEARSYGPDGKRGTEDDIIAR